MPSDINRLSIIGSGIMGSGIGQVAAEAGFQVTIQDVSPEALERCRKTIDASLSRFVAKGKFTADESRQITDRIHFEVDLAEAVRSAELVIEAVTEVLQVKQDLFAKLDTLCQPETVLASNTSQFSISAIASATSRRDKVIGMHFFNPVVLMKLVEIARGIETSDNTLQVARGFCETIGKEVVVCRKDTAGFITTRLTLAQRAEAYRLYDEGVASLEDIDKAMRLAFNHPVGPFQLGDMAGLDTGLFAMEAMTSVYGDRFRPPQYLRQMVQNGYLGRKVGRGFYRYESGEAPKGDKK